MANVISSLQSVSFYSLFTLSNLLLAVLLLIAAFFLNDYNVRRRMPPGPMPWFLFGNTAEIVKPKPWIKFADWAKQYGPIMTVWIGRRPTIVINDPVIAVELMEKRSNIYSSRPRMVIMGELGTNNDGILTMPYGDKWRKHRRLLHGGLMAKSLQNYKPIQELESKRMVLDMIRTPEKYEKHLDRYSTSVVVLVDYGRRVDTPEDPLVKNVLTAMQHAAMLNVPGKFLAETFPILSKVPAFLAPWKQQILDRRVQGRAFFGGLADTVKAKMDKGEAPECFTKHLWEKRPEFPMTDMEFSFLSSALFGAGSDTTASTLCSFVLACTAFGHEWIPKAQEELDRVVGKDRSPCFEDEKDLPYIDAVVKETLRWRPVAVLGGTPHANTQDDYYNGYLIPKGSTILGNLWGIHLNEDYFPDPHHFNPDRFLDPNRPDYPHPAGHSAFGWGRRICPGEGLALNSLFMTLARLLWGFNFAKAKDANGKEIDVDIFAYTDGFNTRPRPFPCSITPRDPEFVEIMRREAEEADRELREKYVNDDDL